MTLDDYLARIGLAERPRTDLEGLRAVMRAHALAVPFENLDVQLGRPVDLDPARSFDKIVRRRRGGWCYEQNGLIGWALGELGFGVMRLAGGVMREAAGDGQLGNHLCLRVTLDRPYLVDVGFGGSLFAPIPFEAGEHDHAPFRLRFAETGDGYWRYTENAGDGPFSFDVAPRPADETLLAEKCAYLQTSPDSPFTQNLVAQRRTADRHFALRGRVLKETTPGGATKRLIGGPAELVETLLARFGLDMPETADLWPAILARHAALFDDASR